MRVRVRFASWIRILLHEELTVVGIAYHNRSTRDHGATMSMLDAGQSTKRGEATFEPHLEDGEISAGGGWKIQPAPLRVPPDDVDARSGLRHRELAPAGRDVEHRGAPFAAGDEEES